MSRSISLFYKDLWLNLQGTRNEFLTQIATYLPPEKNLCLNRRIKPIQKALDSYVITNYISLMGAHGSLVGSADFKSVVLY